MRAVSAQWEYAISVGLEALEAALRTGVSHEAAIDVALARVRSVIPMATEYDVREALAMKLAEKQLAYSQTAAADSRVKIVSSSSDRNVNPN